MFEMVAGIAHRPVGPEQIQRVALLVAEEGHLRDPEIPRRARQVR